MRKPDKPSPRPAAKAPGADASASFSSARSALGQITR